MIVPVRDPNFTSAFHKCLHFASDSQMGITCKALLFAHFCGFIPGLWSIYTTVDGGSWYSRGQAQVDYSIRFQGIISTSNHVACVHRHNQAAAALR